MLKTSRLRLIPFTDELTALVEAQHYDNGPELDHHLTRLAENPTLLHWGSWLVIHQADGNIIGDIGFKGLPSANRTVEIGYGLLDCYQNKGYATESVRALVDWALSRPDVATVSAKTTATNSASIRVLENIGFKKIRVSDTWIHWSCRDPD
ncbi:MULTISPECIES: GNAT family N-acetyltransferase [Exiguobacterium]|uniref:GNAT family N-acetyltransferase n=1 Tax=Exiguobacterium antarcticum TaxID=132920 RepID=A0ABT6R6G1_9BACL|nr:MULTISPECIES: GNAT family N-acetyltransferase [Exiguobacterium]MCT4781522.1 GNAT family N-acetyltransferase [Exiguobacterium soli]MDI3236367.1 GNAT family N-acetyltransferase [Exiguobacterium antarcticum]